MVVALRNTAPSFQQGSTGKVLTPIGPGSSTDQATSMSVQADGKILVAGYSTNSGAGTGSDFAVVRYNANGALDTSFGTGGQVLTAVGPSTSTDQAWSMSVLADGKILVAGYSTNTGAATGTDFAVVRYNVNGALDTSFGTGGKLLTPVGAGSSTDQATSMSVQADGKILVAGYSTNTGAGTGSDFAVVRYNANGALDTSFGAGGQVLTAVGAGTSSDQATSMSVLADGKILVAGISTNSGAGTGSDFAVVRYNANGALDTSFGGVDTLGGTVAYTEDSPSVVLDTDVRIFDVELDARNSGQGDYAGASLTLSRQGGSSAQDVFGFSPTGFSVSGNALKTTGDQTFATFTNAAGQLSVSFTGENLATSALVAQVVRSITYANTSDTPPASVGIAWTIADGGTGGIDPSLTGTGQTTVAITAANDAPVNTVPAALSLGSGGGAITGLSVADPDAGTGALSVSLAVQRGTVDVAAVTNGAAITGSGTSRVTLTGTLAQINTSLLNQNGVTYRGAPGSTDTLTVLTDDGGNMGVGGRKTATDTVLITLASPPPSGSGDPAPVGPSAGDDNLVGTDGPDRISLLSGNDTYASGAGNDLIYGNQGNDSLSGEAGSDTLFGGQGEDVARGGADDDLVYGNLGNDFIYGNQGQDSLYGGQGNDTAFGGQGDDRLYANAGDDFVYGNLGADIIYGNQGNDALYGGQGDDVLYGGQGDDVLVAGLGNDTLVGGLGADRYVFAADPNGRDLILGFKQAEGDRISLGSQNYTVSSALNGDALLTLSGGGVIDLAGIRTDQVSATFFV